MLRNKTNIELVNTLKDIAKDYGYSSDLIDKFSNEDIETGSKAYFHFMKLLKKYAKR